MLLLRRSYSYSQPMTSPTSNSNQNQKGYQSAQQHVIQSKISQIKSDFAKQEFLSQTQKFDSGSESGANSNSNSNAVQLFAQKSHYLQRMNLTPVESYFEQYPLLVNQRSVIEIKNLIYLLKQRCGFSNLDKTLKLYPQLLELHPTQIQTAISLFQQELDIISDHNWQYFIRVEPSILYDTQSMITKIKFYKSILIEIGIEDEQKQTAILRKCIHIIQRDPKTVLETMKEYERLELNLGQLICDYPKAMICSLFRIKSVLNFIQRNFNDSSKSVTQQIIQKCPALLTANLQTSKAVIECLTSFNLFQLSQILEQAPQLLSNGNAIKFEQTLRLFIEDYGIKKPVIRDNLWLILLNCESVQKRVRILRNDYGFELESIFSDEFMFLLKYDQRHIHRYCTQLKKEQATEQ